MEKKNLKKQKKRIKKLKKMRQLKIKKAVVLILNLAAFYAIDILSVSAINKKTHQMVGFFHITYLSSFFLPLIFTILFATFNFEGAFFATTFLANFNTFGLLFFFLYISFFYSFFCNLN